MPLSDAGGRYQGMMGLLLSALETRRNTVLQPSAMRMAINACDFHLKRMDALYW